MTDTNTASETVRDYATHAAAEATPPPCPRCELLRPPVGALCTSCAEGLIAELAEALIAELAEARRLLAEARGDRKVAVHLLADARNATIAALLERDEALGRCREAAQIIIEEIGAEAPLNVGTVARRVVVLLREMTRDRSKLWDLLEASPPLSAGCPEAVLLASVARILGGTCGACGACKGTGENNDCDGYCRECDGVGWRRPEEVSGG